MATARDIVTRALRKRVKEAGYSPDALEISDAMDDFNDMLAIWALDGMDLGHVALEASDTVDVPDSFIQALVLSLAECLTEYGSPLEASDIIKAENGRGHIRATLLSVGVQTMDSAILKRCAEL